MTDSAIRFAELVGELRADMKESQRQRAKLFEMTESMTHQLTELTAKLEVHVEQEGSHWHTLEEHVETLKERVEILETGPSSPSSEGKAKILAGIGGTGMLGVIFGENIVEGIGRLIDALRRALH